MRARRNMVLALWVLAVGGFAVAGVRWTSASTGPTSLQAPPALGTVLAASTSAAADLAAMAVTIIERDVFRLDRAPAPVAFGFDPMTLDPAASEAPDLDAEPAYLPALALAGIIGGRRSWEAVLEGVPDHEAGIVVRQGDVVGDLRIRYVGPDSVIVAGDDTTWTLTLKHEWQP